MSDRGNRITRTQIKWVCGVALLAVVGRYVRLRQRGSEREGLFLFHSERPPSFTVNDKNGFCHCSGCGAHGSGNDLDLAGGAKRQLCPQS